MIIFLGKRTLGRIHEQGGAFHETVFHCITLLQLPIAPVMTVRRRTPGDPGERIPLCGRSVARAYLTTWPFVLAFAALFIGPRLVLPNDAHASGATLLGSVLAVLVFGFVLGFLGLTTYFWLGRARVSGGRIAGWLGSSFALFVVECVVAAFGVRHLFG